MPNSPNNSINADLFCSLFGHNYKLKSDVSSLHEVHICKTCNKEFQLDNFEQISGSPKKSEYISLFRTLLSRIKINRKSIIS